MNSKIIIAKPCHENWNKMTPEEQGRHCAVCSKVVKDFTKMKTDDIVHTLKSTEGEICGRINVKELTPVNKKQKIYFWINGVIFRKAIYPIMALLGVTLVAKKATAQTHDYKLKGKMDVRDYHTNAKKITIVVKTNIGDQPIANAGIFIVSGIKDHGKDLTTDANGRVSIDVEASDIISNEVEIEITALGYEYKRMKIKVIKDIQTVEIRMEEEMMIMGEMMYVPERTIEENKVEKIDSIKILEAIRCPISEIVELPEANFVIDEVDTIEAVVNETNLLATQDEVDVMDENTTVPKPHFVRVEFESDFDIFPVPSNDFVNIVSANDQPFNIDVFDGNGKKIHAIINSTRQYTLNVSGYPGGVYYLLIRVDGKAVETKKIIVTR